MTSENCRHKGSGEKANERIREEVGARIVSKIVKPGEMGWTHGQNVRREIAENISDRETRMLQKTRKSTAMMGGLCEERSKKGRGGRKVERKGQTNNNEWFGVTTVLASPLQNGNDRKNKTRTF